ncbi:MAG: amino acid decarboxylase [Ruminococcaceae bacterium]|nr:amino acid decarboxylase [Oscillospiraceae bacterium]
MNTPIYDFVKGYAEKNGVRFHMPGHKGKGPLGIEALDITEVKGADVLSEAYGIIGESERNASLLFQTGRTVYLTGGSTAAIEAMLALASTRYRTPERPNLLASRNAHRAFLHGVALLDIPVTFMLPDNAETVYSGVMTPNDVARAIEANAPFAVYITSPSYLGEIWDIAGIAAVCKKHGVPLLVDNAHGAYFAFLNPSMHPIHLGAAMCADSAHKTLPVLTGGAYLHIAKGYEDEFSDVKDAVSLFSSTSPSYLTLSSLDLANRVLAEGYGERLKKAVSLTEDTKTALSQAGFTVLPSEPLKIVLLSPHAEALAEVVREHGIECEFCDKTHLVFMTSAENDPSDFDILKTALFAFGKQADAVSQPPPPRLGTPLLSIRDALFAKKERIPVKDAEGRIYAEIAASCPPAVPIAVCGERIEADTVKAFLYYGIEEVSVVKNKE